MKFTDQWSDLLRIPPWTPVDRLGFEFLKIEGVLFQLNSQVYVLALPRDRDLRPTKIPNVTALLWAADIGVARRVALHDCDSDSGTFPSAPPSQLLPTTARYGAVLKYCQGRVGDRSRLGTTHRASDGKHILSSTSQAGMEYAFRENAPTDDAPVIAILVRLISKAFRST